MKPTGARLLAFGIAMVAVLDPSVTSDRRARPLVAVAGSSRDHDIVDRVAGSFQRRFTVTRGLTEAASATVLVGGLLPDESPATLKTPVFGVQTVPAVPDVRFRRVEVPPHAPHHGGIPVDVTVEVNGAKGREVSVDVWNDNTLVKEMKGRALSDSGIVALESAVLLERGPQLLRLTARVDDLPPSDTAYTVVDVRNVRLPVLFFDARPSWNSTFIRRALERDARFSVAHRVITSRGQANTGGNAPASLRDHESLREFAVVVVGVPDALSDGELAGLEAFMRRRGGRVFLLMETGPSPAIARLTGASGWNVAQTAAPAAVRDERANEVLRVREMVWAASMPSDAAVHATSVARDSTRRAVVWSVPVGAGRMIVSGAADAWHGRDNTSGFDAFWVSSIAAQALQAPAPIDVQLSRSALGPGGHTMARVTIRDAFLSDRDQRAARLSALLISRADSTLVRLWPDHAPGQFSGTIVVGPEFGVQRLLVTSGADSVEIPIAVDSNAVIAGESAPQFVAAFVSSRGGRVIPERDVGELPGLIASAIQPVSRVETWHPMRSGWWILPFTILLGAEWWWRRRNGLP